MTTLRAPTTSTVSRTTPSLIQRNALKTAELPERLYAPQDKEVPKVLGGVKIGLRKLVVITGASSGLGLYTSLSLAKTGKYFIVMACRDVEKGKRGMYSNGLGAGHSGGDNLFVHLPGYSIFFDLFLTFSSTVSIYF
jgi:hypothetical protein